MANEQTPIGEITLVGRAAYQIYSRTFRGNVQFRARIGKPWTNTETGETIILPYMLDDSTRDFQDASRLAAEQLEELRTAAFRHRVHKSAASITPLEPMADDELESDTAVALKLA